jgi:hypothetical protein
MTTEEEDAGARLRRAFETYLNGHTPAPAEITEAPLLANWRVVVVQLDSAANALRMLPVLVGRVTAHPLLGDTGTLRTSQLIWLDRNRQWARTWNRVYRLGERAGDEIGGEGVGA